MFATSVSVKVVKVLMWEVKSRSYFELSTVAAVAVSYFFMLVSDAAIYEQCVVSTPAGLSAKLCVDAIVADDGHEVWIDKRWKLAGCVWALCSTEGWQG